MKFDNLLRYAVRITDAYSGDKPLQEWLKAFFRANPQMGSRDRKLVSEMTYCFYRLGHSFKNNTAEDRMLAGLFLCNESPLEALEYLRPEWNEAIDKTVEEKIQMVRDRFPDFSIEQIFPWKNLLSGGVDHAGFCLSFLKKPELFFRARKGEAEVVTARLLEKKVFFKEWEPGGQLFFKAFSAPRTTKLQEMLKIDREAVIQDLSSQKTGYFMKMPDFDPERILRAWDCCAASGGKSLLLADLYPTLDLTVSDIRKPVSENLKVRFAEAGITRYQSFLADLTRERDLPKQSFDLIIADLPCTGSGTWSRTPESLYFFDPGRIDFYRNRQRKILSNIIRCLKPGGTLAYITCSVFSAENDQMVEFLRDFESLRRVEQEMITGYGVRADSLFALSMKKDLQKN